MTNAGIDDARSLTALPDGVRQKFVEAERKRRRERRWIWAALVGVWLTGLGIIVWAISKI
jgi:hypothetical protein